MSTPGFYDIELVLSGVTMLRESLDTLRQHSLEMAVNQFSRRSVQCDFERVEQVATQIRDAAGRLKAMAADANRELPLAEPNRTRNREMT